MSSFHGHRSAIYRASPFATLSRHDDPNRAPAITRAAALSAHISQSVAPHATHSESKGFGFPYILLRTLQHFTTVIAHKPIHQSAFYHLAVADLQFLTMLRPPLFDAIATD